MAPALPRTGDVSRGHAASSAVRRAAAGAITVTVLASSARAGFVSSGPIMDKDFFKEGPSILIDFETRADGTTIDLLDGQSSDMPGDEYADYDPMDLFTPPVGASFSPEIDWVDDGNSQFEAALAMGGSEENAIPSASTDPVTPITEFDVTFTLPVTAFGFFVVNNDAAGLGDPPVFEAYDMNDQLITSVDFGTSGSSPFIDGSFGDVDYGFMGIFSNIPIKRVHITKDAAIFDDLIFAPVPAPSSLLAMTALTGLAGLRRRR